MSVQRSTLMAVALAATLGSAGAAQASQFNVTITNLTYEQIFSPPVVVSHESSVRVASAGGTASAELVAVAEDGNAGPLVALLEGVPEVQDVIAADGPVLPGESVTLTVEAGGKAGVISTVGMLIATNDAFFFGDSIPIPRRGAVTVSADAWDAGSETNSELCTDIPAIACEDGSNPNERNLDDPEEFIHIHRGVHGIADLVPATYDWRNPTALITITRAD